MHKDFSDDAWADYTYWITQDKKKRSRKLISFLRVKGNLTGYWSRTIDEKNRLVYKIEDELIKIIQCKNHYMEAFVVNQRK